MGKRPNMIYILGADHRAAQLGCCGHPILKTPHLDALAREGVRFSKAFCTSPLCTPSRVSHYLGQWERRHGIHFNSASCLEDESPNHEELFNLDNNLHETTNLAAGNGHAVTLEELRQRLTGLLSEAKGGANANGEYLYTPQATTDIRWGNNFDYSSGALIPAPAGTMPLREDL